LFRDYVSLRGAPAASERPRLISKKLEIAKGMPAAVKPDTVRVLGIRVDFLKDSGGSLTTSDGKFNLRDNDEVGALVDPPPHNRDYFMSQLQALSKYYDAQSYGQLVIEYDVYPAERDSAYHLNDIMDYGPWVLAQDSVIVREARDFLIDSIKEADSHDTIDFSRYDACIVFHAGPDFQSDINGDSPRDIPSYTVPLFEDSVAVNGGASYVHMGMVIPETSTQDGFLGALNGVIAHEFGHMLGLPDLYDINTFFPVVGDFSLMDSGNMLQGVLEDPATGDLYAVYGLLPSSLDIWSKAILWPQTVQLAVVESELSLPLEAIETAPQGLFALINAEEYFLVENRQVDLDGDLTVTLRADSTTGVVLGPDDNEYDFLLPGLGGVLIWHIDESAIFGRNVGPYGGVNSNYARRGISLEEADGIKDIGNIYSVYFTGSPEEPFYVGNNTLFSSETYPSSASNSGGYSHITIEVGSPPQLSMQVRAEREWGREGWPAGVGAPLAEGSAWSGDIDADGNADLAFVTVDSVLHIVEPSRDWRHIVVSLPASPVPGLAGRPGPLGSGISGLIFASVPGYGVLAVDGNGTAPRGWSAPLKNVSTAPSLSGDLVMVGLDNGTVAALDSRGRTMWTAGGEGGPVVSPLAVGDMTGDGGTEVAFATTDGKIYVVTQEGAAVDGWPVSWEPDVVWMVAGDLDRDEDSPGMEIVLASSSGTIGALKADGSLWRSWGGRGMRIAGGRPALGDVDGDGYLEIAFVSESGKLFLMNHNLNTVTNWPYDLDQGASADSARWVSSPAMADVDGDGAPEVLVGTLDGDVTAIDAGGTPSPGWPYSVGLAVRSSPTISDFGGDGHMTVIVGGDDGLVYSFFLPEPLSDESSVPWGAYGRDSDLSNVFPMSLLGQPVLPDALMPEDYVYVFPSPVEGDRAYIRYTLGERAEVTATIVDIRGQEVARLRAAGDLEENELEWDTRSLGAGLYFLRIVAVGESGRRQAKTLKVAIAR
jgi:M6 family metalloprotease-like protein